MTHEVNLPDFGTDTFKPYAAFDRHLDCIRVVLRDVSVMEMRVNPELTVYREVFPTGFGAPYAGFTLKGVNHLLHSLGLGLDRAYMLSEIIDEIVKQRPASSLSIILELMATPDDVLKECKVEFLSEVA